MTTGHLCPDCLIEVDVNVEKSAWFCHGCLAGWEPGGKKVLNTLPHSKGETVVMTDKKWEEEAGGL